MSSAHIQRLEERERQADQQLLAHRSTFLRFTHLHHGYAARLQPEFGGLLHLTLQATAYLADMTANVTAARLKQAAWMRLGHHNGIISSAHLEDLINGIKACIIIRDQEHRAVLTTNRVEDIANARWASQRLQICIEEYNAALADEVAWRRGLALTQVLA